MRARAGRILISLFPGSAAPRAPQWPKRGSVTKSADDGIKAGSSDLNSGITERAGVFELDDG